MRVRGVFRVSLAAIAIVALAVIIIALQSAGPSKPESWAAIAGALAVLAAVLSGWIAQRVLELEEDARRPQVRVSLDATSRYGLLLLRVTNSGGSPAHRISIHWDEPIINAKGHPVNFSRNQDTPDLQVLAAGDSISKIVDGYIEFFGKYKEDGSATFRGSVTFFDSAGASYRESFVLDADQFRGTPTYDDEALKTHYEVQQLPARLRELTAEVKRLSNKIEPPQSPPKSPAV